MFPQRIVGMIAIMFDASRGDGELNREALPRRSGFGLLEDGGGHRVSPRGCGRAGE